MGSLRLLTVNSAKTSKGEKLGWLTGILHLAPHTIAGVGNVCPMATGCRNACLYTAGRGRFESVANARIRRTKLFFAERENFMLQLHKDIHSLVRKAKRENMQLCVRPNGTSDLRWETIRYKGATIFEAWPDVQFYDYTKLHNRRHDFENYHLTFSWSERPANQRHAYTLLESGKMNVARVYSNKSRPGVYSTKWNLPTEHDEYPMLDGDEHDLRFFDPKGSYWVGLRAKADAVTDTSGFVTPVTPRTLVLPKQVLLPH